MSKIAKVSGEMSWTSTLEISPIGVTHAHGDWKLSTPLETYLGLMY